MRAGKPDITSLLLQTVAPAGYRAWSSRGGVLGTSLGEALALLGLTRNSAHCLTLQSSR